MNQTPMAKIAGRLSLRRLVILLFVASYLLYAFSPQGKPLYPDLVQGAEVSHIAISLAQYGTFSDPFFSGPTGPTAHTPPAYVFLYALVADLFGIGLTGVIVLSALFLFWDARKKFSGLLN